MSYVVHYFGESFENNKDKLENLIANDFQVSKDISIISVMNRDCYNNSYLIKQCNYNNININIPESTFNISSVEWKNTLKIDSIFKELEKVKTKYVLILDGKDTGILKDLDDSFINIFNELDCDIVFNYQLSNYPLSTFNSKVNHLNAGVCFGRLDSLKEFYNLCSEMNKNDEYISKYNSKPSEQYIVKKAALSSNLNIKIDSGFKLFYTSSFYTLEKRNCSNKIK